MTAKLVLPEKFPGTVGQGKSVNDLMGGTVLGLSAAQLDCVEKLKEAVVQAEKGNVYAIGLVACMKTGYATVVGGTSAAELNLGLDSLKRSILDGVERGR